MDDFDGCMFDEQIKITTATLGERNRLLRENRRLLTEISLQVPTIWAQQERIVMLESLLSTASIGQQERE